MVPERGIQAHVAVAQQYGAQVACGTRVLAWEPLPAPPPPLPPTPPAQPGNSCSSSAGGCSGEGGGVRDGTEGVVVHTEGPGGEKASYWARRVVMAPGPWLSTLVPEMKVGA